jgi:type III secretion protein L
VSKKFFSLIYGDEIRLAPETKVIPGSTFSTLMEADEVLTKVKTEAEQYRQEVIKECEHIKENAFKEGYEAGYQQWAQQFVYLETEVKRAHQESQQSIIPVALKAAKKIVGREIELSSDVISDIVASNLKAVAQHKRITVYVNKVDYEALEKNKVKLRSLFETLESFSIRVRDDISPGGCVIETEIGIINAQIDHRWHVLEKAFEGLIKSSSDRPKGN